MSSDIPTAAPRGDGEAFLRAVAAALDSLGAFRTSVVRPGGGAPVLRVRAVDGGVVSPLGEMIGVRRADDGTPRALWSWGEDVLGGGDARLVAAEIRDVLDPEG
ncbi:hypothetical protein [Actinomadura atramentaria]|uniref:hypothetical protein n=1 Tax=Actinomadura atramentaria TaxID=1990 RepID=UPI0012FB893A|nr:hypothetical protein [Actinomadura atramentaria]